ncbi:transmembrane protein 182-like isoform X2 [Mobula hypostoma]|uniref:transmembrane protein 182-like isoform X2 n=1 Tax=Mobula hypostoma TaxID=723540 RepID=UPI002FC2AF92
MQRYRLLLYCARFFAAVALIFYFASSCTNYWLHAVTCQTVNDTLEDENLRVGEIQEVGGLQGSPKILTESVDNTTDLRSGIVSTFPMTSSGSTKSSRMEPVLPRNRIVQYWKRTKKFVRPSTRRGVYTLLALKDRWVNYHHEGFFWRCSFSDKEEKNQHAVFIYIYQPPVKCCTHAFYSPFPKSEGKTTEGFESSITYRKLWSGLMFFGVIFVTIGFLCIIYYACCQNDNMYKTTGVVFLIAGVSFTVSIIMYALWISAVSQMIAGDIVNCTSTTTNLKFGVNYGWSFMAAPFAVLFSLISGLLFIKIAGMNCKRSDLI